MIHAAPRESTRDKKDLQDRQIDSAVSAILLDASVLYFKTSRSLRHIIGPYFRAYRLLLEEQRAQLSAVIDQISEHKRKMGATVHKSVYEMIHQRSAHDTSPSCIEPLDILDDLREDNERLLARLRDTSAICYDCLDIATASLVEIWIDETARRILVLSQAVD